MEYLIFIASVSTLILVWNYVRYCKSNYQKFDYYLNSETHPIISTICNLWIVILGIVILYILFWGGGVLIKFLFL